MQRSARSSPAACSSALLLTPVATQCAGAGRDGDALRGDAARSPRGRSGGDSARRCSAPGSSRPMPTCSATIPRTADRYMVPEQRVAAVRAHRPGQVAGVDRVATRRSRPITMPTRRPMRANETRTLSQAVVPDQATANAIAARAKARRDDRRSRGARGPNAAVSTLTDQNSRGLCRRRRRPGRGCGVRRRQGDVVGPIQSDFGWVVAKVDSVKTEAASRSTRRARKSPPSSPPTSARARSRIWSTRSRTRLDDGSNFTEAAAAGEAAGDDDAAGHRQRHVARRPELQARRRSSRRRSRPGSTSRRTTRRKLSTLPNDQGYAMVSPVRSCPPRRPARQHSRPGRQGLDPRARRCSAPEGRRDADRRQGRRRACRSPRPIKQSGRATAAGAAAVGAADPDRDSARARCRRPLRMLFTLASRQEPR